MPRRDGTPIWVNAVESRPLRRADLRVGSATSGYDEAWLQSLLHRYPDILPVEQIEPGFGRPIPLCRELTVSFGAGRSGSLDNLFITAQGGLLLVEAKLWRNPEARRSVVAQAMEYAAAIFRLSYEELESAVLRARSSEPIQFGSLFEAVPDNEETGEAEFVDAVSRNLKRGRAIIAVVGDGIREDLAPLAELLQTHAGHRFTFALIELAVYETPQPDVRVVVPSVLAQTALIERGVVQIEDGADGARRIVVKEAAALSHNAQPDRSFGIGEDEFYEILEQRNPGASQLLKEFLTKAKSLGVYADRQKGLNLKHASPSGAALNLGTIDKGGFVETSPATWWERTEIGRRYNDLLASQINGAVSETKNGRESALRTAAGRTPKITDILPRHEDAWLKAIDQYIREIFEEAKDA